MNISQYQSKERLCTFFIDIVHTLTHLMLNPKMHFPYKCKELKGNKQAFTRFNIGTE